MYRRFTLLDLTIFCSKLCLDLLKNLVNFIKAEMFHELKNLNISELA